MLREVELACVIADRFPVTAGHLLIIPKRHEPSWFELSQGELAQCHLLLKKMRERILDEEQDVLGFNVGINAGAVAGQTVMHSHMHLIPRRRNDVTDPRGGVPGVIPGMQSSAAMIPVPAAAARSSRSAACIEGDGRWCPLLRHVHAAWTQLDNRTVSICQYRIFQSADHKPFNQPTVNLSISRYQRLQSAA